MQKLLITGASGFLGWHICQLAQSNWDVYGTYYSHPLDIPGVKMVKVDLTNYQDTKNLIQAIHPSSIIHAAAQSQPNYCQLNPQLSRSINVTATCHLADICADQSIPFAFTSTDLVFDGLNPPYRHTDPVSPVNIYGEQKVEAEQEILARYPQATICRMPLMFGNNTPIAHSFIQPFIHTLKAGQVLNLFSDEIRTPVNGITAAQGILLALAKVQGIIHLGGRERISRYEFGKLLVEIFQLPGEQLKSCLQQDVKMAAPRPKDVSLDSSPAFELGYQPLSLREQLKSLLTPS
ncbi:dTDP-4-dehydrorhamnose reductase [Richelia sinica FACHB-800]|uniref:dTDP-4-dehydrorhamnose reductase n=1 Tax=Richelia sinica FACHB-800 TaxID=1357546 RepID=A0A975Y4I5_9NOST|nr:NAD(P)-dependent oxidoreductase [Richelia sinica]MBD2664697.1 NAD(P)-dependent oxidoreductase [Richelia sinica FACHB-800]QXE23202.1 dTDP-4-dehydrorhamnose reductase [Richelia sinica FACHB-800]